jgi:hypothetical protein
MLPLEFLQYHYNSSDPEVLEQAQYHMAFRFFLDLSPCASGDFAQSPAAMAVILAAVLYWRQHGEVDQSA